MKSAAPGTNGEEERQPIIIVRRRRMEDEGHHGGAWKIAFADFMTAMMALFLVLWLVNASDADTRKAVASYFNPVKLVDRERSRRGLGSPGETNEDDERTEKGAAPAAPDAGEGTAAKRTDGRSRSEARFLAAPDTVLDEREALAMAADAALASEAGEPNATRSGETRIDVSLASELRPDDPYAVEDRPVPDVAKVETERKPDATPSEAVSAEPDSAAESEAAEIRQAILEALPNDAALAEAVEVTRAEGGTLVRLLDGPGYAMFDSGSFVPSGRTVVAMKAIAKMLSGRDGGVRVEGHTDSVPFAGDGDNWRLSTERAHAARLMLARGGLGAKRITQVTGFAASRPLEGLAPTQERNRRIEILLERP